MKKLIYIIFAIILFSSCETEDVAPVSNTKININKIFFFGDSHTDAGHFGKYTAESFGCEFSQCARSGSQAKHYTNADSINKMIEFNPDIIVIRLGTNDVALNDDMSLVYKNYDKLISMIKEKTDCPIVFVNITKISNAGFDLSSKITYFNNYLKSKGNNIDLYNSANYNYIYPDLIHFYPTGYKQQGMLTSDFIKNKYN